jgi:hypothetical protein
MEMRLVWGDCGPSDSGESPMDEDKGRGHGKKKSTNNSRAYFQKGEMNLPQL